LSGFFLAAAFFSTLSAPMTNFEPVVYVLLYAVITLFALWLQEGVNRRALRSIRYPYELALGVLSERVVELSEENERLKEMIANHIAASDLSVYEDVEA